MSTPMAAVSRATCDRCQGELETQALFCPMCGASRSTGGDGLLGKVVGDRYLLRQRIGQGAAGVIYLAEHITVKRRVAVKVIHPELSLDELAIERFRREATTVAAIANEHIVDVLDFGRLDDGRLFLAMELLLGETLAQVIRRERQLPVATCIDVLEQLAEGLAEAHAQGYIHRDLRPSNIFLARRQGKQPFVKILDFGLAKLVHHEGRAATTSVGLTFGDPCYMSPEQARGEGADRRADLYTLGIVAYEMLTGKPPFVAKKAADVLRQQIEEVPAPPSGTRADVPPWLDALVQRALAKRPDERFPTVQRLVEAIRDGITGKSDATRVDIERAPSPRISRALTFGLGILVAAAAVLGVVAVVSVPPVEKTVSPPPAARTPPAPAPAAAPAESPPLLPVAIPAAAPRKAAHAAKAKVTSRLPSKVKEAPPEPYAKPQPAELNIDEDDVEAADNSSDDSAADEPAVAPALAPAARSGEAEFFVKLGQRALRKQDRAAAAAAFRRALAIAPEDEEATAGLRDAERE